MIYVKALGIKIKKGHDRYAQHVSDLVKSVGLDIRRTALNLRHCPAREIGLKMNTVLAESL